MNEKEVNAALIFAARYRSNPTYSLFSYRDGDWTLIETHRNSEDMAEAYLRYCRSGQWGDCLEVRCDGVRVNFGEYDRELTRRRLAKGDGSHPKDWSVSTDKDGQNPVYRFRGNVVDENGQRKN